MIHKKTVVAVGSTYEAIDFIINNKFPKLKMENIYFIKTKDLNKWVKNSNAFIIKSFGDRLSNYFINFLYIDGDKDFDANKLEREIKIVLSLRH